MGHIITTDEKYEARIEICKTCEYFNPVSSRCKICGCFMKIKARLDAAKCDKDKWKE